MSEMQKIEHVENKRGCRHCSIYSKKTFQGLWAVFFDGVNDRLFDHLSCSKYWFITEPYGYMEAELSNFDNWLRENGASLFYVDPGYHNDGVITMIIVPSDLVKFSARVNTVLDTKNRNEAALSIGRYSFSFDKAYTRNVIRKYEPPSAYDSVKSAMDYLTWKDIKKGSE
jgi:hypothetical protein